MNYAFCVAAAIKMYGEGWFTIASIHQTRWGGFRLTNQRPSRFALRRRVG